MARGESLGQHITFGYLESMDAAAAIAFAAQCRPGERMGAIGVSLGAAAALLGAKPLHVNALVLESVFPDIHAAPVDRFKVHLGRFGGASLIVAPIFEALMPAVLGVHADQLRPIDPYWAQMLPFLTAKLQTVPR